MPGHFMAGPRYHCSMRPPPRPLSSHWDLRYRRSRHQRLWDTGRPSRHLVAALRSGLVKTGAALEIGCGSGTNALYLARRGFAVTAVDASQRALKLARAKSRAAGILSTRTPQPGQVRFHWADATDLWDLPVADFVLDRLCFHLIEPRDRKYYLDGLRRHTHPGSVYLMLSIASAERKPDDAPFTLATVRPLFRRHFRILTVERTRLDPPDSRPGYCWVMIRKGSRSPSNRR